MSNNSRSEAAGLVIGSSNGATRDLLGEATARRVPELGYRRRVSFESTNSGGGAPPEMDASNCFESRFFYRVQHLMVDVGLLSPPVRPF